MTDQADLQATPKPSKSPGPQSPETPRPSPRRLARLAAILFFDGFRAAPGWMALVTGMLILGSVAGTCYPLGYRLLVDGAIAGDAGKTAAGVAFVAVMLGLSWVLTAIGATESMALGDRIAIYRVHKLIELISGVPGLEHLERPDYLAQVEQLNAGRRQLATAPRRISRTPRRPPGSSRCWCCWARSRRGCCCSRSRPRHRCSPTGSQRRSPRARRTRWRPTAAWPP